MPRSSGWHFLPFFWNNENAAIFFDEFHFAFRGDAEFFTKSLRYRHLALFGYPQNPSHQKHNLDVSGTSPTLCQRPAAGAPGFKIPSLRFSGGKWIRILWSSSVNMINRETSIEAPVCVGPVTGLRLRLRPGRPHRPVKRKAESGLIMPPSVFWQVRLVGRS